MIKKLMRSKRGEGYIDTAISVVVFVMILVVAINIFSFIALKQEMDQIAEELIEAATYAGSFEGEFWNRDSELLNQYYYYGISTSAEKYFNSGYSRVQLGDAMTVKIDVTTHLKGLGIFKIPITVSVTRSGISEKYWK
ncbi:MAG: DUF4320 family protein [Oscillospiraceae bacterium]|nr:DUF4320 family protein [Oscillospiraceae bacterium]